MANTDGSTTPTQDSYDASHSRSESAGERRAFIQAHRSAISSHISRFAPTANLGSLLGSITAPAPNLLTIVRQNRLVSWAGTGLDEQQRVPICLLNDQFAVATRDAAVKFSMVHQDDWPTLDNSQPWQQHGNDLATLVDLLSQQETERTGVSFVPAPRPPKEIKTQEDLWELNEIIVDLETRVEDVMLVDDTIAT